MKIDDISEHLTATCLTLNYWLNLSSQKHLYKKEKFLVYTMVAASMTKSPIRREWKSFCHRLTYFTLIHRYSIDRSKDPGRRFIVTPDCEVKVKRGLDGETLDREALAGLPEPMYEVHILAKDKGNCSKLISGIYMSW